MATAHYLLPCKNFNQKRAFSSLDQVLNEGIEGFRQFASFCIRKLSLQLQTHKSHLSVFSARTQTHQQHMNSPCLPLRCHATKIQLNPVNPTSPWWSTHPKFQVSASFVFLLVWHDLKPVVARQVRYNRI